MDFIRILIGFVVCSFVTLDVKGCGRLKCYKCNSQDSPNTCDESNFDSQVHKGDTTSGSVSSYTGGTSCIRGWAENSNGVYYYRDQSSSKLWDGCETPELCVCNEDLCNSRGSRSVSLSSLVAAVLVVHLVATVVKQILV